MNGIMSVDYITRIYISNIKAVHLFITDLYVYLKLEI